MTTMRNAINFFEIPATNHERAIKFYEKLLGQKLLRDEIQGVKMAFFRSNEKTVGGAICTGKGYRPTTNGIVFYLNGGSDLHLFLDKVRSLGGKPIDSPTHIPDQMGSFAYFLDTEGNKIGVHSKN